MPGVPRQRRRGRPVREVVDPIRRFRDRLAELLGACLPDPSPVEVAPLPPPAPGEGVQLVMPPHPVPAGSESEICFASYFDFTGQIPERYLDPTGEFYYAKPLERALSTADRAPYGGVKFTLTKFF